MHLLKNILNLAKKKKSLTKEGIEGINEVGHRKYVGDLWDEMGNLQFNFLINNGLKSDDIFLDIACGSLRAGVKLIPYLNEGNYLGIEKELSLIELGIKKELGDKLYRTKKPELIISNKFEFKKLSKIPNYAIAQSLFTHLPPKLINSCFKNLRSHFDEKGIFFATFFLADRKFNNPSKPHDHDSFRYTIEEMKNFGEENGWKAEYLGNWNHPRNQKIVKYTIKPLSNDSSTKI